MIFNDDATLSYQQRIGETATYLKYCQHKTRKLNSEEQQFVLRQCMLDRISRMPDDNEQVLMSLKQYLDPSKQFSVRTTEYVGDLENLGLIIPAISDAISEPKPEKTPSVDTSNNIDIDFNHAVDSQPNIHQHQKSLTDIINIFYGTSVTDLSETSIESEPDPQKIEDIVGTLLLLANRLEKSEYSLIDILPQLGDAFDAREEIIKIVLNETIETMFDLLDIDKFHDVKLKSSLNSPLKRKAFLFDLLSQSFQRTKIQHEKGVYLDQALELYHQKLKTLGLS